MPMPMPIWQEGQQQSFDSFAESDLQRALHQAKLSRDRWKFWSGDVPEHINRTVEELERVALMKKCQLIKVEENDSKEETTIVAPKTILSETMELVKIERDTNETKETISDVVPSQNKSWKSLFCCH